MNASNHHPEDRREPNDAALDQNLRAALPELDLPDPSAAQRAAWKRPGTRHEAEARVERALSHRGWFSRPRMLAAAAGLAIVAGVGVVLFPIHGPTARVEASTILRSLQAEAVDRLRLEFAGIEMEGNSINGLVQLRFDRAVNVAELVGGEGGGAPPRALGLAQLQVDLNLIIADDGQRHQVVVKGGLGGGVDGKSNWVLLNADAATVKNLGVPITLPSGGVYIDLGAEAAQWFNHEMMGDEVEAAADEDAQAVLPAAPEPAGELADNQERIVQAIQQLFGGQGLAGLSNLHGALERAGAAATLSRTGDQSYRLSAPIGQLMRDEGDPVDPDFKDVVMVIHYLDGQGVQSISFTGLGGATGAMKIEFLSGPIDAGLLDGAAHARPGQTLMINVDAIKAMLSGLGEN